jgi:hypothetical protein
VIFTTHELADGSRARLRLARPTDTARVQAFLEGAPEFAVRRLTYYDPHERLTLLAVAFEDGTERIVGIAEVALRGEGAGEVAVTVRDDLVPEGAEALLREAEAYTQLSLAPRRRRAA